MAAAERISTSPRRPVLTVVADLPARRPVSPAAVGWAALIGGIVLFDGWALATGHETLSACFDRLGRQHQQTRSIKVGVVAALTYHLLFEKGTNR